MLMKIGTRSLVIAALLLCNQTSEAVDSTVQFAESKRIAQTNLLQGKRPLSSSGVAAPAQLTDGIAVPEGDFWLTNRATHLRNSSSFVIYDLGGPRLILCAFLQGDNNDVYRMEGSINGDKFYPLFVAPPAEGAGMRTRSSKPLVATARFVRISATGGDGSYSLSEAGLFHRCPDVWPVELQRAEGRPLTITAWMLFGALALSALVYSFLFARRQSRVVKLVGLCVPLLVAMLLLRQLALLYALF